MVIVLYLILIILEPKLSSEELCRHLIQQRKSSPLQSQVSINNVQKVPKIEIILQTVTVYKIFKDQHRLFG